MAHLDLAALLAGDIPTFNLVSGEKFTLNPDVDARFVLGLRERAGGNLSQDDMLDLIDAALATADDRRRFKEAWDEGKVGVKALVQIVKFITAEAVTVPDPTPGATGSLPG